MLTQQLKVTLQEYKSTRPDPKIREPIALAGAISEARKIRDELEVFLEIVRHDEVEFMARFQSATGVENVYSPGRFAPVPRQSTVIETIREFIRRNRGEEFNTVDVIESCGLHGTPAATVRGLLARLRDQGLLRRPQRGVYKALPRKKKSKPQKEASDA